MWLFNKKYSLVDIGILQGFTDWHCHLLPGVDDGVRTMEEALQILDSYEHHGVQEVWLTPHIMEDIPNTTAHLRKCFADLQNAYKGHIALHLASENMLDSLFSQRLQQGDLLPLGNEGRHLLVETSYFNPPYNFHNFFRQIQSKGLIPVLAHPERYVYMEKREYEKLRSMNVAFQLNLTSFTGIYGEISKRKAQWLLENGFYSFYGTDTHRLASWEKVSETKQIPKGIIKLL